jgi:hypothetical protein
MTKQEQIEQLKALIKEAKELLKSVDRLKQILQK